MYDQIMASRLAGALENRLGREILVNFFLSYDKQHKVWIISSMEIVNNLQTDSVNFFFVLKPLFEGFYKKIE